MSRQTSSQGVYSAASKIANKAKAFMGMSNFSISTLLFVVYMGGIFRCSKEGNCIWSGLFIISDQWIQPLRNIAFESGLCWEASIHSFECRLSAWGNDQFASCLYLRWRNDLWRTHLGYYCCYQVFNLFWENVVIHPDFPHINCSSYLSFFFRCSYVFEWVV